MAFLPPANGIFSPSERYNSPSSLSDGYLHGHLRGVSGDPCETHHFSTLEECRKFFQEPNPVSKIITISTTETLCGRFSDLLLSLRYFEFSERLQNHTTVANTVKVRFRVTGDLQVWRQFQGESYTLFVLEVWRLRS